MRWNYHPRTKKAKQIFIFFPRFCSNCKMCFWLEWLTIPEHCTTLAKCPLCGDSTSFTKDTKQVY